MSMTGSYNLDQSRRSRESLGAMQYWSSSYYEYRHDALEAQLLQLRMIAPEELKSGRMTTPPAAVKRVATADMIAAILAAGGPTLRPSNRPQQFAIGDKVRARIISTEGHTRLPRYAMGRVGEIVAVHGTHVYPDSNAAGEGENPHWLYNVRFTARELWGKDGPDSVCIDLWEPYLESL
jgi:nitrile hydratase